MSNLNKENHPNLSREEQLRMENEIEKLKLSAFQDAKFFSTNKELPPEVENEWLKYIAHFENAYEDVEQITVAEKLGAPEFPAIESLSEEEITEKLDHVQQCMAEEGIFLDTITEVPDAEVYRFITEELFKHEIDDVDIEGLQTLFIYEEFYPNDELDIEHTMEDFLLQLFDEQFHDHLHIHLADTCETAEGELISGERAAEKAIAFSELYDELEIGTINSFTCNIDEQNNKALASFDISYQATTGQEVRRFEGEATATMAKGELGYWSIVKFNMPGFVL